MLISIYLVIHGFYNSRFFPSPKKRELQGPPVPVGPPEIYVIMHLPLPWIPQEENNPHLGYPKRGTAPAWDTPRGKTLPGIPPEGNPRKGGPPKREKVLGNPRKGDPPEREKMLGNP